MSILFTLTQSADLYAPVKDQSGKSSYAGTATTSGVKCRVEPTTKRIVTGRDHIEEADVEIFLDGSARVATDYKVVVNSTSYVVMKCMEERGLSAIEHYELICRRLPE